MITENHNQSQKCTSMDFLKELTKGDPEMMIEIIDVYLVENPKVVKKIKDALSSGDLDAVAKGAHMMKPSLLTVGIPDDYKAMLKQVEELAKQKEDLTKIKELFLKVENVCTRSYDELNEKVIELKRQ